MEAAFYLVAHDHAFVYTNEEGPFLGSDKTGCVPRANPEYHVGANMNDTFFFACADCEDIPWDEIVNVVAKVRLLPSEEQAWYLTHWATKKRGYDPQIPKVLEKLNEYRAKWKEAPDAPEN